MLTAFLLLPLGGVLMIAFLPREREHEARWIALIASGRVQVPPAPAQPLPAPEIRAYVREDAEVNKVLKRR